MNGGMGTKWTKIVYHNNNGDKLNSSLVTVLLLCGWPSTPVTLISVPFSCSRTHYMKNIITPLILRPRALKVYFWTTLRELWYLHNIISLCRLL